MEVLLGSCGESSHDFTIHNEKNTLTHLNTHSFLQPYACLCVTGAVYHVYHGISMVYYGIAMFWTCDVYCTFNNLESTLCHINIIAH